MTRKKSVYMFNTDTLNFSFTHFLICGWWSLPEWEGKYEGPIVVWYSICYIKYRTGMINLTRYMDVLYFPIHSINDPLLYAKHSIRNF